MHVPRDGSRYTQTLPRPTLINHHQRREKDKKVFFLKILIPYIALKMTIWAMLIGLRARKRHNSVFQCRTAHAGVGAWAGGQGECEEGREVFSPLLTCEDAFRPSQQPRIVLIVVT